MTQITVQVEERSKRFVFDRHIGSGHCDGYDFDLGVASDGSPFITVNDKSYIVDIEGIVQAVIAAVTKPSVTNSEETK